MNSRHYVIYALNEFPPQLHCSHCDLHLHHTCINITKSEATSILTNNPHWTCNRCIQDIFPFANTNDEIPTPNVKIINKCMSCNKNLPKLDKNSYTVGMV